MQTDGGAAGASGKYWSGDQACEGALVGRVAHGGFLAEVTSSSDLREVTGEPATQSSGEEQPGEEQHIGWNRGR